MPRRALAHALAAIALWGTLAALALRLKHLPPFLLVGLSLVLGGLCGARSLTLRGMKPTTLALGVYGMFAYHFCLFTALRLAPPVEANLLNYLWPLFMVVLAPVLVPGTRLSGRHIAGALLGFVGAALLVTGGRLGFSGHASSGHLLGMAAALIWSTYSLATRRLGGFPTSAISLFCLVSGALALLCHALFEPAAMLTRLDLPWLVVIGLGPMGAAFYLWDRALAHGDPVVIGTLAYLTPLLSTLLLALASGAAPSGAALLAMTLIIGGAAVGSSSSRR